MSADAVWAATEAVCNANQDLPFEAQEGISALASKSLMYRETGGDGELRWEMLESIREYALKRLTEAGEAETLRARHAAFFAGYLEERFDLILSREQDRVIQEIDVDIGNVRVAWDWALATRRTASRCGTKARDRAPTDSLANHSM